MQGAIVITWGSGRPGREAKGFEIFSRALEYFEGLAKEGRIHGHREYFSLTGNISKWGGLMVIDGQLDELQKVLISDENLRLMQEADAIVDNFSVTLCGGGSDQAVGELVTRSVETLSNLGYQSK
ncbi:MAG: hypothetical protein ACLGHL_08535 [Actinomycetota bacterium]